MNNEFFVYKSLSNIIDIKKDLLLGDSIVILWDTKKILVNNNIIFNYNETNEKVIEFEYGDVITIGDLDIFLCEDSKIVSNGKIETSNNLKEITTLENKYLEYPQYTNSPRIIKRIDQSEISLESPPESEKDDSMGTILKRMVPAVTSLAIGIGMLWLRPRGIIGLVMIIGVVIGFVMSTIMLYKTYKENKIYNEKREKIYTDYLEEKEEELNYRSIVELDAQNYNNLSQNQIIEQIKSNSYRLYEKDLTDDDFLSLRIGTYNADVQFGLKDPFSKIQLDYEKMEEKLKNLYDKYKRIDNSPLIVNMKSNIGLVGESIYLHREIHNILSQVYFLQSYLDVNIIVITNEENQSQYEYLKYLKHSINPMTEITNIIVDTSSRDQLLNSYTQMMRTRDQENDGKRIFAPHLLFIIDDASLINNHPIMEFLQKNEKQLAFTLLYMVNNSYELPKNVNTVIEYKNLNEGVLLLNEGEDVNIDFKLEPLIYDTEFLELMTRKIGQLEHIKGVKSSIPENLGFLEMFDVSNTKDLQISRRWSENKSYKSLAALIGKKSETDYIELNLHEKAHGPHGLVAGTTGSGKSEVIQTYILSLALNFSPYEVGFLLIDYKGGGMANLFKDMPHHLGSITNLDGYQSMRALASIKSELKRRQAIFSKNDVNHINGYHELFEKNKVQEPLPHLFLISDEFAELKSEQPEFMKELVSAARIGRSLGIHLILATQKPTGVVDEQIWTNSKFKLCLKVAEESDSKELLKTPDAAYITNAGRGYLKVGTNEMYELFQSGYSGASYGLVNDEYVDESIYVEDLFGHKQLINEEVNETEENEVGDISELYAVLEEIDEVYKNKEFVSIPKPWMPPLEAKIVMSHEFNESEKLKVEFGLVDLPDSQQQIPLTHDFVASGHLAIFGNSGFGKSITILTLLMRLSYQNDSKDLKYYILDFGTGTLQVLKQLNHTADYFKADDTLRINKLFKLLNEEIAKRKKKFEQILVTNITSYNNKIDPENKVPSIIVSVDNFDALRDMDREYIEVFATLCNQAANFGIYFIFTGNKANSIKTSIMNNVAKRIVLYTNDKTDVASLIGKTQYPINEIPGRAFVKIENVEVSQLYTPVESELEIDFVDDVTKLITNVNNKYLHKNESLPKMPNVLEYEIPDVDLSTGIYIGKEYEYVKDLYVELKSMTLYGGIQSGKSNVLKIIIEQIKDQKSITILDNIKNEFAKFNYYDNICVTTKVADEMFDKDVYILNGTSFFNNLDRKEEKEVLQRLYEEYQTGKIFIIENEDILKGTGDLFKAFKKPTTAIYFNNPSDQSLVRIKDRVLKEEEFEFTNAYLINKGKITKFKHPEYIENKDISEISIDDIKEDEFIFGDVNIKIDEMLVAGEKSNIVFDNIISQLDEKDISYTLIKNVDDIKNLKETNTLHLIDYDGFLELSLGERKDALNIFEKYSVPIILKSSVDLKGLTDYLRKFKKPQKSIICEDLSNQKFVRVRNIEYKEKELGNLDGFYITEKEVIEIDI